MNAYGLSQESLTCPSSHLGDAGTFFLALINVLLSNQCQLGNPSDYPANFALSINENDLFDYIIVGGGTSGSVVARKLAENTQNKILLLEAGGYPSATSDIPAFHLSTQKTSEDWQFSSEKSETSCLSYKDGRCPYPAGKVLGGSSTINNMNYVRAGEHSFNHWASRGAIGWSYEDVLPYYKLSEKSDDRDSSVHYGKQGLLHLTKNHISLLDEPIRTKIIESFKEYKAKTHGGGIGVLQAPQTIHQGVRQNTAKAFLGESDLYKNLKVATKSIVEKVLIDKDSKQAIGVKVDIAGKILDLYAEKEVILSAGTFNTPKILMLSGIGPKEHLSSLGIETIHNLQVGANLQDHLTYPFFAIKVNDSAMKAIDHNPTDQLYKYFGNREGPLGTTGLSNLLGYIKTQQNVSAPNIKLSYTLIPRQDSYFLVQYKKNLQVLETIYDTLIDTNRDSHILLVQITLLDAKSKGVLRLQSRNPLQKPIIQSGMCTHKKDVETLLEGIKFAEHQVQSAPFKELSAEILKIDVPNCRATKFRSDDYWRCHIRNLAAPGFSPIGTCKMGLSFDPDAIVDPLSRVHGIEKLRVVDSSVLPSSTGNDNYATAVMVGQKISKYIMQGWDVLRERNDVD